MTINRYALLAHFDPEGEVVKYTDHLSALAQARREALEEAARRASSIGQLMSDPSMKHLCLMVAEEIDALAEKEAPRG